MHIPIDFISDYRKDEIRSAFQKALDHDPDNKYQLWDLATRICNLSEGEVRCAEHIAEQVTDKKEYQHLT